MLLRPETLFPLLRGLAIFWARCSSISEISVRALARACSVCLSRSRFECVADMGLSSCDESESAALLLDAPPNECRDNGFCSNCLAAERLSRPPFGGLLSVMLVPMKQNEFLARPRLSASTQTCGTRHRHIWSERGNKLTSAGFGSTAARARFLGHRLCEAQRVALLLTEHDCFAPESRQSFEKCFFSRFVWWRVSTATLLTLLQGFLGFNGLSPSCLDLVRYQ